MATAKDLYVWQQDFLTRLIWCAGIISSIMGVLLAVGTWILRGTLFNGVIPGSNLDNLGGCIQGTHGVVQNWGNVQGILFLEVGLTENWLIFVTRGGGRLPSWQLVGAILGVDVCFLPCRLCQLLTFCL